MSSSARKSRGKPLMGMGGYCAVSSCKHKQILIKPNLLDVFMVMGSIENVPRCIISDMTASDSGA